MPPNVETEVRQRTSAQRLITSPMSKEAIESEYGEEILIHGRWYNIQSFVKKHPGGRIINFYRGKDATQAYEEFHMRSKKAEKWLKSVKSRPDDGAAKLNAVENDALVKDFTALRAELKEEGFFEPQPMHVAYRFAEVLAMHALGFWLLLNGWCWTGIAVLGIVEGRCGWLMHEGGHLSLTGNIAIDIALQVVTYGVGCGMSAAFWRNQHNKHHATPQKIGQDVDLDTLPLVAFHADVQNGKQGKLLKNPVVSHWVRLQAWLFAPVTCLIVALGWQLFLHPKHSLRTGRYHELASMAARYAVVAWFATQPQFTVSEVVLGYLAYNWVGSSYIFCNFAVSHTHLPVLQEDEDVSWVRYSSDHTMNVLPGPFGFVNWWMSYLNFQIEHHLFPSMPQLNHPKISPRVQALFKKHGVEYIQMSYTEAMKVTFMNLHNVGRDVFYG